MNLKVCIKISEIKHLKVTSEADFLSNVTFTVYDESNKGVKNLKIKLKNGNEYSTIKTNRELVGIINRGNFKDVVDIILQRNSVQMEEEITAEDLTKVKNKNKVMQLMEKMKKGQKQLDKTREKKRECQNTDRL